MLPVGAGCWAEIQMGKRSGRASAVAETRRARREHRVMTAFLPPFIGSAAGTLHGRTPSAPPWVLKSLDALAEPAESGKGGSDAEVCRRDAHEPHVPVAYCHRNGFTSTAPAWAELPIQRRNTARWKPPGRSSGA